MNFQGDESSVCSTVQNLPEVHEEEDEEITSEDCCTDSMHTHSQPHLEQLRPFLGQPQSWSAVDNLRYFRFSVAFCGSCKQFILCEWLSILLVLLCYYCNHFNWTHKGESGSYPVSRSHFLLWLWMKRSTFYKTFYNQKNNETMPQGHIHTFNQETSLSVKIILTHFVTAWNCPLRDQRLDRNGYIH